jgi:UDP-4-amino-4,6-dideoxy-N-acetyl-beta-L-altrosamine transaminase
MKFLGYGKQLIEEDDVRAVTQVLSHGALTCGQEVEKFEKAFAQKVGSKFAVAVSNGTAALHLAYMAAGLDENTELITSGLTFASTANAAFFCNSRPVFADIRNDGLLKVDSLKEKLSSKTRIVAPVHYSGKVCDMKSIQLACQNQDVVIVEDACHALGAADDSGMVGNCAYSDMCCFSFHPVKPIATGEGGMITTNDEKYYSSLKKLRSHGIEKDEEYNAQNGLPPWFQSMFCLGYNYRLTDFQCALGLSQLNKLDRLISRRRELAARYNEAFADLPEVGILNAKDEPGKHAFHLYVIKLETGDKRDELFSFLMERQIGTQVHYVPVYWHPFYQNLGYKKGSCPGVENVFDGNLSIPLFPAMTDADQERVIEAIYSFFKRG